MTLMIEDRPSDSPLVERIWHSHSEGINSFLSIAASRCDLVVWKQEGKTYLTLRGPETKASPAPVPDNTEFFGILFKIGTFMPDLPIHTLIDSGVDLPEAGGQSFWLKGSAWEFPTYDNADTFIDRLVREELLVREPAVGDVLRGASPYLSLRSVQRRFQRATGLTYSTIQQIERARQAAIRLKQGELILDTVHALGYFDQPHLTRSLKHFIGQTPAQLMDQIQPAQLSFLYNTAQPD